MTHAGNLLPLFPRLITFSRMTDLWKGLRATAQASLSHRDYTPGSLLQRLATSGVEAGELFDRSQPGLAEVWIPGVAIFPRKIHPQRHRGFFGELARRDEGPLAELGLWPKQWATARLFAGTAKGFHIHPPHVPAGEDVEKWFQRLFNDKSTDGGPPPYDLEQWDTMFFVQGAVEMLLVDERAGLPRRVMRFVIEGDDRPGLNNAGVVIPAGVAHALRVEGSRDLIMVYGTSTAFDPAYEGRIASGVESAPLPAEWEEFLRQD